MENFPWPSVMALLAVAGVLTGGGFGYAMILSRVKAAEGEITLLRDADKQAQLRNAELLAAIAEFREKVASSYATTALLERVEAKMTESMDKLGDRFERVADLIMKVVAKCPSCAG